jgi:hypothetical protein
VNAHRAGPDRHTRARRALAALVGLLAVVGLGTVACLAQRPMTVVPIPTITAAATPRTTPTVTPAAPSTAPSTATVTQTVTQTRTVTRVLTPRTTSTRTR